MDRVPKRGPSSCPKTGPLGTPFSDIWMEKFSAALAALGSVDFRGDAGLRRGISAKTFPEANS